MQQFTCIDATTGQVLYSGTGDDPQVLETPDIEVVLEIAPPGTYRAGGAWIAIPARPSSAHVWNWTTKVWEDPRTLADHKANKIISLKSQRDLFLNSGFVWSGSTFDSDPVSQTRLLGLRVNAQNNPSMVEQWRLANNTWRSLSATDALAVWDAFETHMRSAFQTFATLEAQVLAATTVSQIDGITWP
jgi:hypothetical protein